MVFYIKLSISFGLAVCLSICYASDQKVEGTPRYLIYDVNPVEGFNLRRDVYMRIANMVKLMRESDPSWVLVLPPFSSIYHWRSIVDQDKVPWSAFFDVASLNRHVPVIEFADFLLAMNKDKQLSGESVYPFVDQYYQLQNDMEFFKTGKWKEGVRVADCSEDPQIRLINKVYRGLFFGYTEVSAVNFDCLTTAADIDFFARWLLASTNAQVVMLGHAEVIIHGKYSEWSAEWWTARRSMRYSKELVKIANNYRQEFLNSHDESDKTEMAENWQNVQKEVDSAVGGPYLCAHWRRADYVLSYPDKSPGPVAAARQLKKLLNKASLSSIYLSTDTNDMEVLRMTKLLEPDNIKVFQYKPNRPTLIAIKDGGVAIIDQVICSHAQFFVGSYASTFSFRIQEDRVIMGFSPDSTFNRVCGDNETESSCEQPSRWKVVYPIKQSSSTHAGHEHGEL